MANEFTATRAIAIGGIEDHIHLLVRFPTTVSVAALVKQVKGSSSHLVTHKLAPGCTFKWQGYYGAFTLSKAEVPSVRDYVLGQVGHHARGELDFVWELDDAYLDEH